MISTIIATFKLKILITYWNKSVTIIQRFCFACINVSNLYEMFIQIITNFLKLIQIFNLIWIFFSTRPSSELGT